jgi:hypothetical protein
VRGRTGDGRRHDHERPAQPGVRTATAGWLLAHSTFGWPLVIAGVLKIAYDLTLLAMFHDVGPPEERVAAAA